METTAEMYPPYERSRTALELASRRRARARRHKQARKLRSSIDDALWWAGMPGPYARAQQLRCAAEIGHHAGRLFALREESEAFPRWHGGHHRCEG